MEEKKEEAVKAAANCSPEHFQNLQEQFFSELVITPFKIVFADKKFKDLPLRGICSDFQGAMLQVLASAKLINLYLAHFHVITSGKMLYCTLQCFL